MATRKNGRHLRVPVLPEEEAAIKAMAKNTGLSIAAYLRNVGLGYEPKSVTDQKAIGDLLKINADLGRLGGLLKMWLTNDEKLKMYEPVQIQATINGALSKIAQVQLELLDKVKKLS
ncbi:MAG: conjugal transfer transcriptional regulator TraJ [Syntrophobacteraceae bacterium]